MPNELFYDGILEPVASPGINYFLNRFIWHSSIFMFNILDSTDWFVGSNILPNPECPIIFDSNKGD